MACNWSPSELREQIGEIEAALEALDSLLDDSNDGASVANRQALRDARAALEWIGHYGGAG